jgi:hypothetical protein
MHAVLAVPLIPSHWHEPQRTVEAIAAAVLSPPFLLRVDVSQGRDLECI